MVSQFSGKKYKLESSTNFDEYMKAIGVGAVTRKVGMTLTPVVELQVNGDTYTFSSDSKVKSTQIKFKLGEEFDEVTLDGRKVKSVITQEGNKLNHIQKGDKQTTLVYEFSDDQLKITLTAGDVVATRIYKPQ
ncbi:fatty acid-binding protein, muscle [Anabrus simplex]|uniref:fatty acid-binding protein, muscle n=1 Tax=Anabrus simplex TaxID=316456 RepID=UPI0035A37B7B